MSGLYKFKLGCGCMHQQHVGIAVFGNFEGLAGTHGHPLEFNTGILFKARFQIFEQARILRAGGGCHHQAIGGLGGRCAGHIARSAGQKQKTG